MLERPNMLLIGAAGRNAGKTELACEVIRRLAPRRAVVGVKVTCVDESLGKCPRGGQGCGVCASLDGPFCIVEERGALGPKDTSRMLRAGAERVLWLRVHKEKLQEGVAALIAQIPPNRPIVCESNSARHVVAPGLFLVVRQLGSTAVKPSCAAVLPLADAVIDFLGPQGGYSLSPQHILLFAERFLLQPQATAIILAGGESQRMGRDKSLLDAGGLPMIEQVAGQLAFFPEILISANAPEKYRALAYPVIPDDAPLKGPLMGLACTLERASFDTCFVTGCDTPIIDTTFILSLLAGAATFDAVVPRLENGQIEPLLAVYRASIAAVARKLLEEGQRRVLCLLDAVRTGYVPFGPPSWYRNLNTPGEYEEWLRRRGVEL